MRRQVTSKPFRWAIIGALMAVTTILIAGMLNILSYRQTAAGIFTNSQRFVAVGAAEQMEYATRLGKPLERFYGAEDILRGIVENSDEIHSVWVMNSGRELLYSVPAMTREDIEYYRLEGDERYQETGGAFYIEQPFSGGNSICMLLDGREVSAMVRDYYLTILRYAVILAGLAITCINILIRMLHLGKRAVIIVIIVMQLVFGLLITSSYQESYLESLDGTARIIGNVIKRDVAKLESAGIPPEEFIDFEEYLQDISDRIPEIDGIRAGSVSNRPHVDLGVPELGLYGLINEKAVRETLTGYLIDTIVLTAITVFLILEILFFADGLMEKPGNRKVESKANLVTTRLLFFVLYLGVNMGAAFIATVSYRLCLQAGIANDMMIGLPITVEMGMGLIGILLSGAISQRLGYRRTLILCIVICAGGTALSGLAQNIALFALARAITGFGFSLATITGRIIATGQPTAKDRSTMLANLTGSTLIGYCCGAVIGGLLSDRFSYAVVFLASAAIPLLCLPLVRRCTFPEIGGAVFSMRSLFALLRAKGALTYLLLMVLPIYAAGMFITYCVPLFGSMQGLTTTLISALLMANSLIAAYLSPYSNRFVEWRMGSEKGSVLYGLLIAAAITLFAAIPSTQILFLVVVLLGVADSFGLVVLLEGFTSNLHVSKSGGSTSMIAATLSGKAGQSVAPPLLAAGGGTPVLLAVATAAGTLLYALFFRKRKAVEHEFSGIHK